MFTTGNHRVPNFYLKMMNETYYLQFSPYVFVINVDLFFSRGVEAALFTSLNLYLWDSCVSGEKQFRQDESWPFCHLGYNFINLNLPFLFEV